MRGSGCSFRMAFVRNTPDMVHHLDGVINACSPTAASINARTHLRELPPCRKRLALIKNLHDAAGRCVPNTVGGAADGNPINNQGETSLYSFDEPVISIGCLSQRKVAHKTGER